MVTLQLFISVINENLLFFVDSSGSATVEEFILNLRLACDVFTCFELEN